MLKGKSVSLPVAMVVAVIGAAALAVALLVDWQDMVARVFATLIGLWLAVSGGVVLFRAVRARQ
jgi:predicted Kef-type K+ transport protein